MKLKVIRRVAEEVETELDLPLYLYYQDEFFDEVYVKITEKSRTTIKREYFGLSLDVNYNFTVEETDLLKTQTTEKIFNQVYNEFISQVNGEIYTSSDDNDIDSFISLVLAKVEPKLSAQEEAFFIAGFTECAKHFNFGKKVRGHEYAYHVASNFINNPDPRLEKVLSKLTDTEWDTLRDRFADFYMSLIGE